jgi:hypothetical protein
MEYFKPTEFVDYKTMSPFLLEKLDLLRKELDTPMRLSATNEKSGHLPNSPHYIGKAVDFVCKADKLIILDKIIELGFMGIGWYTLDYWHIDVRQDIPQHWVGENLSPTDFSKIKYTYYSSLDEYKDVLKKAWGIV